MKGEAAGHLEAQTLGLHHKLKAKLAQTVKVSAYNAGDPDSIRGLGRSPGEGNGSPLQYFCLENPMDRGAWQATVHGVVKSRTRLSDFTSLMELAQTQEVGRNSLQLLLGILTRSLWDHY